MPVIDVFFTAELLCAELLSAELLTAALLRDELLCAETPYLSKTKSTRYDACLLSD
jgi:hypothetical protein